MRITCPLCGPRDRREFYYYGSDDYLNRPATDDPEAWDNYLHLRDNPAGQTRDLWYHDMGCAAWLELTRNTVTHEISAVRLVAEPPIADPETAPAPTPKKKAKRA